MIKDTFPMNIGEEKVRSERTLLAGVEDGKNMMSADSVRFLVLHCSATRRNQDYSVEQLRRDHKARGFYEYRLSLLHPKRWYDDAAPKAAGGRGSCPTI